MALEENFIEMELTIKAIDKTEESKWFYLPLILILLLTVVLSFDFSFDLIGFKESKTILFKLIWSSLVFSPLLLLPFFSYWKTLVTYEKILILALATFFIVISHKYATVFLVSALFGMAVGIYFLHKRVIYRPELFSLLVFAYVLINTVSLLWTSNVAQGLEHLKHLSPLLFIPAFFCFFRLDKKQFDLIALFVFRATVCYAVYSICSWAIESRFLQYSLEDSFVFGKYVINGVAPYDVVYAWTNHMHPTYNAVAMLFALGIGWYYVGLSDIKDNIGRFELYFFVGITLLLAVLTASRFMLVAWVLVNFFGVLFLARENKKLFMSILCFCLVVALVGISIYSKGIKTFIDDSSRIALYQGAFDAIKANMWHGVGLGSMSQYVNKYGLSDFIHLHPHNQFVGDWMQTGILGLLAMLGIVGVLFFQSVVQRNWLLCISWFIYVLLMCIEMPLIYPNGIFFFGLVFSFLLQKEQKAIPWFDFYRKV